MTESARRLPLIVLVLGLLDTLTPFSIDLYLPAFPNIASDLHTDVQKVSISVGTYFIGFALGQIIYGPLLDRFGRKPPLYLGIGIYILASIGCMTAHSVEALLVFRFLSALGGSAAAVGATAMVRDYFPVEQSARIFSILMLILSISPLLAPTVGSLVVTSIGWRALFVILSGIAFSLLFLVRFGLPLAYEPDPSVVLRLGPIFRGFRQVFQNRQFRSYTLAGSLSFAGLFVFVASAPSIFMDGFHVGPRGFGLIFAVLVSGMIGGGQLNHLLVKKFGSAKSFRATFIFQTAVAVLFFAAVQSGTIGMYGAIFGLFLILTCAGIGYPNAAATALEPFTQGMGSASALMGFLQLGVGAFCSAFVGFLKMGGLGATAAVMVTACGIGLILFLWGTRQSIAAPEQISA